MTAMQQDPPETTTPAAPTAEAERPADRLFKWSTWVNVGEGADECDERYSGKCSKPEHFHAWCRLPNGFQVRDITEKASAAAALRRRAMRREDSDARIVMEDELDELRESALTDEGKAILVDEIVDEDFQEDFTRATREVDDMDDPDYVPKDDEPTPKLYAEIAQHREEYMRQRALPEEQRSPDYAEMEELVANYSRAIDARMEEIQQPRKAGLMERPLDDLIEIIRRKRIEEAANEVYLHTFNMWTWYVCTFKPRGENKTPNERRWSDINVMRHEEAPEVIARVQSAFRVLENDAVTGGRGKG